MKRYSPMVSNAKSGEYIRHADYLAKLAEIRAAVEAERTEWVNLYELARHGCCPCSSDDPAWQPSEHAQGATDALLSEAE